MSLFRRRSTVKSAPPLFVGVVAATSATGSATAVIPFTPADRQLLVVAFRSNNVHTAHAAPDGTWTKVGGVTVTGGTSSISHWYKIAGASEPTSITFTDAGAANSDINVLVYRQASATPLDKFTTADGGSTSVATLTIGPPAATTVANEIVVASIALSSNSAWSKTWTNGFSQRTSTVRLSTASRKVTATGTYSSTETWVTARRACGIISTFKAA